MFDLSEADLAGGHLEGELVGLATRSHAYWIVAEQSLHAPVWGYPRFRRSDRNPHQPVAGEPACVDRGRTEWLESRTPSAETPNCVRARRRSWRHPTRQERRARRLGLSAVRPAVPDHADTGSALAIPVASSSRSAGATAGRGCRYRAPRCPRARRPLLGVSHRHASFVSAIRESDRPLFPDERKLFLFL